MEDRKTNFEHGLRIYSSNDDADDLNNDYDDNDALEDVDVDVVVEPLVDVYDIPALVA